MPGKKRECDGCHKMMRSDNLKNHMRKCNGLNQNLNVSNENIRYPFADNSSKMSKSINPKITALIDAIVNEEDEPPEKIQRKDLAENSTDDERQHYPDTLDLTSKVVTDENDDEDDDDEDDDDEDSMTSKDDSTASKDNLSPDELKDRLHRFFDEMTVFELNIDADKRLSKNDIVEYAEELEIPYFRGVFEKDELPEISNPIECGIVNLGDYWACYAKLPNRCYFDSFGRKTPMELQFYLKTAEEIKNNSPVIMRNSNVVQRENSEISGHLCLFVLTSLMREDLSFKQVKDQLVFGFSKDYW